MDFLIRDVSSGKVDCARYKELAPPIFKLFPIRCISGAIAFVDPAALMAPFVVVAVQPYLRHVVKPLIVGYLFGRDVAG